MEQLDLAVLHFFNQSLSSPTADVVSDVLTNVRYWYAVYTVGGVFLIYRYKWPGVRMVATAVLLVAFADSFDHIVLKPLIDRPRPCALLPTGAHIVPWLRLPAGMRYDPSFPSSHALNNFAVSMFFVVVFPRSKGVRWLFFVAFLISIGRLYEGVHYPSDVVGGAGIGLLLGWIVALFYRMIERKIIARSSPALTQIDRPR